MTEKKQTKDEYVDLSEEEPVEEVKPVQNDIGLPTMDSLLPAIGLDDVFDTSLLPTI